MDQAGIWKNIKSYSVWVLGAIILALLLRTFVVEKVVVSGSSMLPSFHNGEHLFIEKISYRVHNPERFDVIILEAPESRNNDLYIKRVIGLPNEKVQIKDGNVYINGVQLEDPYGGIQMKRAGVAETEITLGENEYFVLGDNRNGSDDSRTFGPFGVDKIRGRVCLRVWPLNSIKTF